LISQEAKGNPLYNALELERRKLTALVDADFAKAVLLPQNDPTEQAEQTREQLTELILLRGGQDVPISPRDNHLIHIQVCQKAVDSLRDQAAQDTSVWPVMGGIGDHVQAHIQAAEQMGQGKQVANAKSWLAKLDSTLQQLMQHQKEVVAQHLASTPPAPPSPTGDPAQDAALQKAHQNNVIAKNAKESITISYKDLPPSVKRQLEASLGFTPAPDGELPEEPKPNLDPNSTPAAE
jgi:hypothetical protein